MRCCIAVVLALSLTIAATGRAEELASGLYAMKDEGRGQVVARADTDGQVVLGQRLSAQLREATLVAMSNDNSLFQLSLVAGPIPEGGDQQHMAIGAAGLCMPVASHSDRRPDGSISVSGSVQGQEAAEKIASELGIKPRLRSHPGHQLAVSFRPQKPTYAPGEAVTLVMTIKNAGTTTVRFLDGGSQRGPRNNQFGFTAFRNYGFGRAVPDVGDPQNFGGVAGFKTLGPGEIFTKEAKLTDWFKLDTPDSYQITGMYHLTLLGESMSEALWDDFAVGRCVVRIVGEAKAGLPPAP